MKTGIKIEQWYHEDDRYQLKEGERIHGYGMSNLDNDGTGNVSGVPDWVIVEYPMQENNQPKTDTYKLDPDTAKLRQLVLSFRGFELRANVAGELPTATLLVDLHAAHYESDLYMDMIASLIQERIILSKTHRKLDIRFVER